MGDDLRFLQFSKDKCLKLGVGQAIFCLLFLLVALDYLFHFFPLYHDGFFGFLLGPLESGGGWPGFLLWSALGIHVGLWAWRSFWRVKDRSPAVELQADGLRLHPSFRAGSMIPYRDIGEISLRREPFSGLFMPPILRFRIRIGRRTAWMRSNEIEGGTEALKAFVAELEARRTFEE